MAKIIGKGYSFDDVLIVPKYSLIPSRKDINFKTKFTRNYSIDIPIVAANMDTVCEDKMAIALGKLGGIGVIHRFNTIEEQGRFVKNVRLEKLVCAAAIGVTDFEKRAAYLAEAGVNIFVLDIAHGHHKNAGKALEYLKKNYPSIDVMAGNIATKEAAKYFVDKGADGVKVGIGPGSMCITRGMTGAGVPQLTAIMDAYQETNNLISLCADGGIRFPGDITKAIGAGADTVMLGSVFSGTEESPGNVLENDGKKQKLYRGMASYDATIKKLRLDGKKVPEVVSVEGEKTYVDYKGPIEPIVKSFLGGLASGMSYMGAKNIASAKGKADFIEMSSMGVGESIAHGLKR